MKTNSKKLLLLLLAMLPGMFLYGAEFELFRNGKALAVIGKCKDGSKKLAQDIQFFNDELFLVTGSRLPVVASPAPGKNRILFKLEKRPLATTDNYSITFPDKNTLLITATEQSARYALNRILQNYGGIRYFFMPLKGVYGKEINHYPRKKNISLPRKPFRDAPKVNLYRQASWRNRISQNWNNNMLIHGVHMLPVEVYPVWKYAANQSWPKEILPVIRGKKFLPKKPAKLPISKHPFVAKRGYDCHFQFCWSNPKAVTIAVENIRELLNKEPDRKHINMDVNDNGGFCECKNCKALVKGKRNSIGRLDYSEIYWKWVNEVAKEIQNLSSENYQQNIWTFIEEHLEHLPPYILKDNNLEAVAERDIRILFDRLISYYVQRGYPVPIDAAEFQEGLKERFVERDGMYFTASQASEYDEKKKTAVEFVPMGLIVSNEADGIEWLRNRLRVHGPQTYQQIQPEWMQAINGLRKNDILPELKDLLYENFIEEADGKWRLPNVQDDVDKAALRTKALLKEFKIYVEVAQKPKAKLKEVRVEAVRAGFKQCYIDKDFQTIVTVGDKIPQNLLTEDEILLQFYDIAINHV